MTPNSKELGNRGVGMNLSVFLPATRFVSAVSYPVPGYYGSTAKTLLQGLADYPAAIFPVELVAAYPEAAIILSYRSEDKWFASMESTLVHLQRTRTPDDPSPMAVLSRKYHRHCWGVDFETTGREFFNQHNQLVRDSARGRKFLEWQPQDGWGPLCAFLGVDAPPEGTPFPRSDDWLEYKKRVEEEKHSLAKQGALIDATP